MARKKPPAQPRGLAIDRPERTQETDDASERQARYKFWAEEIETARKGRKAYDDRCKEIIKRYRGPKRGEGDNPFDKGSHQFNIFWSNIQTLQPATYSRDPQPNVSRRFLDRDPISRIAGIICERNLISAVELVDFAYPMKRARDDYLLVATGAVWVRYEPEMGLAPVRTPVTKIDLEGSGRSVYRPFSGGDEIEASSVKYDEDEGHYTETEEETVLTHGLALDHVTYTDLLWEDVNDWKKVGWVAKKVQMNRAKLVKFFGKDIGRKVELNKTTRPKDDEASSSYRADSSPRLRCADVWEIVSRDEKKVIWWSDGYKGDTLKELDDPLHISGFWPLPRPLFGTQTTDTLEPVPDFVLYKDQADQLDKLTARIDKLMQALRVVGFFSSEFEELQKLFGESEENDMVPLANWVSFAQAGGFKGSVDWLPIEQIQTVLLGLVQLRSQIKQDLYEVSGLADVMRGASDPNETATAQDIKQSWGSMRLKEKQSEMSRFARDTLRIMAEIQCEHYPPETLIEMSGIRETDEFRIPEVKPPKPGDMADMQRFQMETQAAQAKAAENEKKLMAAVELLKSDRLRSFRIDVETDATVAPDQQKEKETRVEFLTAVAPFIEKASQVGLQAPQMVPLLMKMLEFGVRGFRAGRTLESAIEETIAMAEQMQQQARDNPEAGQGDPEAEAAAADMKAAVEKVKAEIARIQAQTQADQAANERKRLEDEERLNQQRELFKKQMLKLTEEIQFRRDEHQKKMNELQGQITKHEADVAAFNRQQGDQKALGELQGMIPQGIPPEQQALAEAETQAKLAAAQTQLVEARAKLAQLVSQAQGMDGITNALEMPEVDVSKLGSPLFGKKKPPTKKVVGFIRDETGQIQGATVDEIDIDGGEAAA